MRVVVGLNAAASPDVKLTPIPAMFDSGETALIPEVVELCRWAPRVLHRADRNDAPRAKPGDELRPLAVRPSWFILIVPRSEALRQPE